MLNEKEVRTDIEWKLHCTPKYSYSWGGKEKEGDTIRETKVRSRLRSTSSQRTVCRLSEGTMYTCTLPHFSCLCAPTKTHHTHTHTHTDTHTHACYECTDVVSHRSIKDPADSPFLFLAQTVEGLASGASRVGLAAADDGVHNTAGEEEADEHCGGGVERLGDDDTTDAAWCDTSCLRTLGERASIRQTSVWLSSSSSCSLVMRMGSSSFFLLLLLRVLLVPLFLL
jgi:hypothetical protein